ncbi:glycerophosphoryl diester phosphodiesterase, partial [Vibrio vulnificus]|nr:glycerophosphoryl diester phosphodiesterase [Vibrio vulnificus]
MFPRIIAHRGASAVAPENTIAAFTEALRVGAEGIE